MALGIDLCFPHHDNELAQVLLMCFFKMFFLLIFFSLIFLLFFRVVCLSGAVGEGRREMQIV